MKKLASLFALVLFVSPLAICAASDVTGKWNGSLDMPNGNNVALTLTLKQDGSQLTGTMASPQGELPIAEGKKDGDKISFSITLAGSSGERKVNFEGPATENEIKLTVRVDGWDQSPTIVFKKAS